MLRKTASIDNRTPSVKLIWLLYIALLFRPILLINFDLTIFDLKLLEFYSILVSYLSIVLLFLNFKIIKFNYLAFLMIFFAIFSALGLLIGANAKELCRIVFPFLFFFIGFSLINNMSSLRRLLISLYVGYLVYIVINFVDIAILGGGFSFRIFQTGLSRYRGLVGGTHTLAHSMFIFSFIFVFIFQVFRIKRWYLELLLLVPLLMSYFCIFKSGTRTVLIGLLTFWLSYFWLSNKKYFLAFVTFIFLGAVLQYSYINTLFWDVTSAVEHKRLEQAGSGRISIWENALLEYQHYNFENKIMGLGLGAKIKNKHHNKKVFVAMTHNDYLGLLLTTGLIGLAIYVFIMIIVLFDIFRFRGNVELQSLYLSFVISVLIMNALSNSYVSRVEIAQLFWLFIGIFYSLKRILIYQGSKIEMELKSKCQLQE